MIRWPRPPAIVAVAWAGIGTQPTPEDAAYKKTRTLDRRHNLLQRDQSWGARARPRTALRNDRRMPCCVSIRKILARKMRGSLSDAAVSLRSIRVPGGLVASKASLYASRLSLPGSDPWV
jgi:hypothetical protein